MYFCAISSLVNIEKTRGNAMHMALAHLCDNEKYVEFFNSEAEDDKFIILDNSIVELGKALPLDDLLVAAEKINAHEIIIPDGYKSAKQTVNFAEQYMPRARKEWKGRIMCVAHGKTIEEWAWCAKKLIDLKIDTIGIPKVMVEILGANGRKMCLRKLKRMYKEGLISYIPDIHLLGIWDDPLEVADIERRGDLKVRSCDSVLAHKYAAYGLHFADGTRPKGPTNFFTDRADDLIHMENINELRGLCGEVPNEYVSMDMFETRWPQHNPKCEIKGNVAYFDFESKN